MTKPNLLVATDSFLPRWDGIARVLKELLPFLTDSFTIHLAFPNYPGTRPELAGVHYVPFPLRPLFKTSTIGWPVPIPSLIQSEVKWADLVWTHTAAPIGGACIAEAAKTGTPVVSMVHSIEWEVYSQNFLFGKSLAKFAWRQMARTRYNRVKHILTPSIITAGALAQNDIMPPISVTPLGVSLHQFKPLPENLKEEQRSVLGLPPGVPVVGYLGRFSREKGLATLLAAHKMAQKKSPVHLLLVGGHPNELPSAARSPTITVVGPTEEPERYYQMMDLYVLPSHTESFPLGILEAMACQVAPLATPVGSIPEYLIDGSNGFLFPKKDAMALGRLLVRLLSNSQEREGIAAAARETVINGFTWESAATRIEAHLKEA